MRQGARRKHCRAPKLTIPFHHQRRPRVLVRTLGAGRGGLPRWKCRRPGGAGRGAKRSSSAFTTSGPRRPKAEAADSESKTLSSLELTVWHAQITVDFEAEARDQNKMLDGMVRAHS